MFLVKSVVMETWERVGRGLEKRLKDHIAKWDRDNKCVRFYRTTYFTGNSKRGPVPFSPYEGKEEILVDGNEERIIVKKMGFGYYKNNRVVEKALYKLGVRWLPKPLSNDVDGIQYS